jgi:hypothetical protein
MPRSGILRSSPTRICAEHVSVLAVRVHAHHRSLRLLIWLCAWEGKEIHRNRLIHRSAWNRNSRKFICRIVHNYTPVPLKTPAPGTPQSPTPLELVTPMDRYARWWMLPPGTNVCSRAMIRKATPKTRVSPGASGRGYGVDDLSP